MRIERVSRSITKFISQLCAALVKTLVTSAILGVGLVLVMHYMGVPVPSSGDLLRGVSRLANILS